MRYVIGLVTLACFLCTGCTPPAVTLDKIQSRIDYYRSQIVELRDRGEAVASELTAAVAEIQKIGEEVIEWAGSATEPPTLDQAREYSTRFWAAVARTQTAYRAGEAVYVDAEALYREAEKELLLISGSSTLDDIKAVIAFLAGLLK